MGSLVKSGQTVSLKIELRSALTTGSRLAMVSGLSTSISARVSVRYARPAT